MNERVNGVGNPDLDQWGFQILNLNIEAGQILVQIPPHVPKIHQIYRA